MKLEQVRVIMNTGTYRIVLVFLIWLNIAVRINSQIRPPNRRR